MEEKIKLKNIYLEVGEEMQMVLIEFQKIIEKHNQIIFLGEMETYSSLQRIIGNSEGHSSLMISNGIWLHTLKKTDSLRIFLGMDNDKNWKNLLFLAENGQGLVSGNLIPSLGYMKSVKKLIESIIIMSGDLDWLCEKFTNELGIPFTYADLCDMYIFSEEYTDYIVKKNNKPKRKRTHIPKGIRHEVFKRDNYTCVECGAKKEDGATLHIDHILPVSKGGTDEMDNLQTLCADCNLNKNDVYQRC